MTAGGAEVVLVFEGQGARCIPGVLQPDGAPIAERGLATEDLGALDPAEAQRRLVSFQVLQAEAHLDAGAASFAVVGQSLGEVAALVVAGCLTCDDALELVTQRAELPASLVDAGEWSMWAVTRQPVARAEEVALAHGVVLACRNGPEDFVVVGRPDDVDRFGADLGLSPSTWRSLPVTYPYHTPVMAPVAAAIGALVDRLALAPPTVATVTSSARRRIVTEADARSVLVDSLVTPVDWAAALGVGAAAWPDARWLECGPSYSLHRFVWKNQVELTWPRFS